MVDTVIVGQYLGEDALAAVGSTGCLMFLVLGFANGIAQGFGVMVSHAFGAKDMKLLRHCVALSLLLTVVISMILTVPTVAFSRQLLLWLNTPENILTLANRYIRVIFAGIFATMAYNVASGILRGIGDSRTPLYFLIPFKRTLETKKLLQNTRKHGKKPARYANPLPTLPSLRLNVRCPMMQSALTITTQD